MSSRTKCWGGGFLGAFSVEDWDTGDPFWELLNTTALRQRMRPLYGECDFSGMGRVVSAGL